jgi:hypothetical protein
VRRLVQRAAATALAATALIAMLPPMPATASKVHSTQATRTIFYLAISQGQQQSWVSNGDIAGTTGQAKSMEALHILAFSLGRCAGQLRYGASGGRTGVVAKTSRSTSGPAFLVTG